MNTKPTKRKFINYEENSRWARTAHQAALLHDRVMDGFRVHSGLEFSVGTRAVECTVPGEIPLKLHDQYKGNPRGLPIREWICRNFNAQRTSKTNLIHKTVLVEMRDMFLAFLTNPDLEIAETTYKGQELMVRSTRPLSSTTPLNGLEFICFPVPELEHTPFDIKFNEEYTFTDTYGKGFIQLGPASLLNHHCDPAIRNVEQFGKKGGKLGNRGNRHLADKVMTFKPTLTRSIGKEEELLIDYGENFFGQANRECKCSALHARPIVLYNTSRGTSSSGGENRVLRQRKSKRVLRGDRTEAQDQCTTTTPAIPSPPPAATRPDAPTTKTALDGESSSLLMGFGDPFTEDEAVSVRGRSPSVDMDLDYSSDEETMEPSVVKATDPEMSRAHDIQLVPIMRRTPDTPGLEFESCSPISSERELFETTPESPTTLSAKKSDSRPNHRHGTPNGENVIEDELEYYDYDLYGEIRPERAKRSKVTNGYSDS